MRQCVIALWKQKGKRRLCVRIIACHLRSTVLLGCDCLHRNLKGTLPLQQRVLFHLLGLFQWGLGWLGWWSRCIGRSIGGIQLFLGGGFCWSQTAAAIGRVVWLAVAGSSYTGGPSRREALRRVLGRSLRPKNASTLFLYNRAWIFPSIAWCNSNLASFQGITYPPNLLCTCIVSLDRRGDVGRRICPCILCQSR